MTQISDKEYYHCPACGKHFRWWNDTPGIRVVCAVIHPADTCCHYLEEEALDEQLLGKTKS